VRRQLKKRPGAQARPSYEHPPEETKLIKATYLVEERQQAGATFESAVAALDQPRASCPRRPLVGPDQADDGLVRAGAKIPHWKRPNGSVAPE
jgi:hypothetical protein